MRLIFYVFFAFSCFQFYSPASAAAPTLLATHLDIGADGRPRLLKFDPDSVGSGLTISISGVEVFDSNCKFGSRDAKSHDPELSDRLDEARRVAEAELGEKVVRVGVCTTNSLPLFPAGGGAAKVKWSSAWGESRDITMWSASSGNTLIIFVFGER